MPKIAAPSGATFTFRIDPNLKAEFVAATELEHKPVAQVLREFMSAYVANKRRNAFEAEAHSQSRQIANSREEKQVMDWISDVTDVGDWK